MGPKDEDEDEDERTKVSMKGFFAPLSEPLGAIWCLMFVGVLWLLFRRQWRSAIWLGSPTVLLLLFGSTPLVEALVAAEEKPWVVGTKEQTVGGGRRTEDGGRRAEAVQPADAVVALGGGQRISRNDLLGFAMADGGNRVLTAIELVRLRRARTLVLGGSGPMPDRPDLPSMFSVQEWVNAWGLVGGGVTNLGLCSNKHDEAVAFRKLLQNHGWEKVLLVTSALHMRRSLAVFQKEGVNVTPVAADFHVQGMAPKSSFSPFPRQHRLLLWGFYLHEKIGWLIYRARGWV